MKPPYFSCLEDRLHFKKTCSYDFKRRQNKITIGIAMDRITRDRYLPPHDVWRVATDLCSCIARSTINITSRAYSFECEAVGMLKGEPILYRSHPYYRCLIEELMKLKKVPEKKRSHLHFELGVLNFFIKHKITGIAK